MDLSNENVVHIKTENAEFLQFRKLLEYKDIITHAFSIGKEVNFNTIREVNYPKAMKYYENLCTSLNLDKTNIIKPRQVHKDQIGIVQENTQKYPNTDGLITQKEDVILATTSADCILILFFDPITKTIANVHSGWRGTYQEIGVKAVRKMQEECNVKPENLICCMCPSIRKCHFEVQKDVKDLFEEKYKDIIDIDTIIEKKQNTEGKWDIDTVQLNKILLQKEGIKEENIIDSKICTVCNSDTLHSCRAEKEGFGLETAIITLK